jgi:hypothetical protein
LQGVGCRGAARRGGAAATARQWSRKGGPGRARRRWPCRGRRAAARAPGRPLGRRSRRSSRPASRPRRVRRPGPTARRLPPPPLPAIPRSPELLMRRPWMPGQSDIDQLGKIFQVGRLLSRGRRHFRVGDVWGGKDIPGEGGTGQGDWERGTGGVCGRGGGIRAWALEGCRQGEGQGRCQLDRGAAAATAAPPSLSGDGAPLRPAPAPANSRMARGLCRAGPRGPIRLPRPRPRCAAAAGPGHAVP